MKNLLLIFALALTASAQTLIAGGAKLDNRNNDPPAETYTWTAEEAVQLKDAQADYALAIQAQRVAEQRYLATAARIHDAHGWPPDVIFNGQKWVKQEQPKPTAPAQAPAK